jgi:hypothetical protein
MDDDMLVMKKRKRRGEEKRGTVVVSRWTSRLGMSRRGVFDKVTCGDVRFGTGSGNSISVCRGLYAEADNGKAKGKTNTIKWK